MGDADKFEHFVIMRRSDGSLWELGRGAMGVTYKAFDTNLRSDVALKVINAQYLNSETARQRFLREARAAASLHHPNVATVFHLGNSDGRFFYAMEYVEGETVERRVQREGPLSADLALRITRQVARALIAADRQKLVHRDIKPSNVMLVLDADEDHLLVKVIDFGLAKSLGAPVDQSVTMSMGGFVGTPHFASPEQLEEKEIDVRSDLYSLGATLWFMLTGRPPFQGSMASVINQHLSQPLPADILARLHPRLAELTGKMLAKLPENRFQSPADLKRELDGVLSDLKGQSPTLVPIYPIASASNQSAGAATIAGTSTAGFATGQLIRNRYQIVGQSPFDMNLFKARDLHSSRVVALRPLPLAVGYDTTRVELLKQEVERFRIIHHPNLVEILGFETYERGVFIVSEWIKGFSLQELLRARRELAWEETLRIAKPLAKVLDFVAERKILTGRLSLRQAFVEVPHLAEESHELHRTPISSWPPFIVKVDALSLGQMTPENLTEPTQTVVDQVALDFPTNHVQQLAWVTYELLGGVKPTPSIGGAVPRLNPVPNLSEPGNVILRIGATEPNRFATASDFLSDLEGSEIHNQPHLISSIANTAPVPGMLPPAMYPQVSSRSTQAPPLPDPVEDSQPKTSPLLLRILLTGIGLFLLCALGAVIGVNFFLHKPDAPLTAAETGSVSVTSKPEGATVKWNGQELGKTPLSAYPLPRGKYILELSLPGYQTRSLEVEINKGSLNNLGLIPLIHDVGQLSLKSTPDNLSVEIVDSENKTTIGKTPMMVDNLPVGTYTVRIKRPGWPDYSEVVIIRPNASTIVEHSFKGIQVTLQSDPAGATIYLGSSELGKTPVTVELPSGRVQLVSRIGALAPVTQEFVPGRDGKQVVEFKHDYGVVSISSDRPDSEVSIAGVDLGKLPIEAILPPGRHQIVVHSEGLPDQSKTVDVRAGQKVSMQANFTTTSGVAATLTLGQDTRDEENAQPTPKPARPKTPRPEQTPTYRTQEDYERAKDAAYRRFDDEWEGRKNALKRQKDYYDYQIDHSEGAAKEKWKAKKEEIERRLDQLDDQKDNAESILKRQWND
jgi:serine/threonine protein kinase